MRSRRRQNEGHGHALWDHRNVFDCVAAAAIITAGMLNKPARVSLLRSVRDTIFCMSDRSVDVDV